MTTNLTPSAQAILEALRTGPASADELREHVHRSKSTTDKALNELTKAGLITVAPQDGESDPTRWTLADTTPATDIPDTAPGTAPQDDANDPETGSANADAAPSAEPSIDETLTGNEPAREADAEPTPSSEGEQSEAPAPEAETADAVDVRRSPDGPDETPQTTKIDDATGEPAAGTSPEAPAEQVKICRGCQEQMPKLCPCCWQKTTAYCGTCRKSGRQGAPGQREILFNGLPKLTNGELHRLILDVMKAQPLPEHHGITGWTGGRVAIFLPGRSTGAISKALESLTGAEKIQRIGENPRRYQLPPNPEPEPHEPPAADLPTGSQQPE